MADICAGINVPLTEERGKLLLIVDKTYALNLASELALLQQDLSGDGWTVIETIDHNPLHFRFQQVRSAQSVLRIETVHAEK